MKKFKKVLNYVLSGLAILYGMILLFPQVLFSNCITYKNFTVYFHSEKHDIQKLTAILDKSWTLLSASEVFDSEKKQKIFFCDSYEEFTFFAPRSRKSFAVNYPLMQNIFLTQSDIGKNEIKRNSPENNLRTLSGIIAHETTHSGLEDELGLFKYKMLPSWKNEGYCDYIAKESSYDEKLGWTQICENNGEEGPPSFRYFKYKVYVQYLIEEEQVSGDTFLVKDFDPETIAFKSRKVLCPNSVE